MEEITEADQPSQSSHLFVLRLWLEDLGSGKTDWRGKVQHVRSGETRYFRDWSTLEAFVERQMRNANPEGLRADGMQETDKGPR